MALYPAVVIEREVERQKRSTARREAVRCVQEVDEVKRRAFIGLGLSVVLLGPEAAARASAMYGGEGGESAREDALRLYETADWRGPGQIKLHRAASEVDANDAVATLSHLSEAQRSDRFVRRTAMHVLDRADGTGAVAGVPELRELLAA